MERKNRRNYVFAFMLFLFFAFATPKTASAAAYRVDLSAVKNDRQTIDIGEQKLYKGDVLLLAGESNGELPSGTRSDIDGMKVSKVVYYAGTQNVLEENLADTDAAGFYSSAFRNGYVVKGFDELKYVQADRKKFDYWKIRMTQARYRATEEEDKENGFLLEGDVRHYILVLEAVFEGESAAERLASLKYVTFDANGGTGTMEPYTVEEGGKFVLPECGFTPPEQKLFLGWMVNGVTCQLGEQLTLEQDVVVQAVWGENSNPAEPEIQKDVSLENAEVTLRQDSYTYNGQQIKPAVRAVTLNGEDVLANVYEVSYGDNVNAGEGTVTVAAKDGYHFIGKVTKTFTITPAKDNQVAARLTTKKVQAEKLKKTSISFYLEGSSKYGTVTYRVTKATGKAKASKVKVKQDGKVTLRMGLKEGKVTILIKSAGTNNWNEATKEVVVRII